MKKITVKIVFYSAIILMNFVSHGQQFSKNVVPFIYTQEPITSITNVTIIDGTGSPAKHGQDIVFRNNKIIAIGKSGTVKIPKMGKLIDGSGKTITPGFVMMHEHLFYAKPMLTGGLKAYHMPFLFAKMYLAGGVTTMRTAGSLEANADLNVKSLVDSGKMPGPDIDVSTPQIDRGGTGVPQVKSLFENDNVESWLDYWFDKGVTSVKIYNYVSKDDVERIIKAAHKKNIKVTGHLCSVTYREAIEMGIDNLEHSFNAATDFVSDKSVNQCVSGEASLRELDIENPKLLDLMNSLIKNDVTLTYTPTVFEPDKTSELVPGGGENTLCSSWKEQAIMVHNHLKNSPNADLKVESFKKEMERVKKFHEMGGKITVGTDPTGSGKTIPGYANHRAIELLVETGFSIEESIKIASLNGATYLGINDKTGTIEIGKEADLVLIDGDLTQDVSNIRNMKIVFKDGVGFDSKKIFSSVVGQVGL